MLKVFYLKVSDFAKDREEVLRPWVSCQTWQEVQMYKNEQVRRTKLLGESMIHWLLKTERHLLPASYRLMRSEHGKPYVDGVSPAFFFNISHSGDYIVCAVADREVGIDIERKTQARMEVARRFFHPTEVACLEVLSGEEQKELFFAYWTAKESFVKYTGRGLGASLAAFEVKWEEEAYARIILDGCQQAVYVRECRIDKEYACSVCTPISFEKIEICNAYPLMWKK